VAQFVWKPSLNVRGKGLNAQIGEKISVCLLTYNHVEAIESTLSSILDQTVAGYEVIVSDDCSTDGTWERLLAIAEEDSRVRPIRTPHNMGMPGNANFAVAQSDRPYIALLHHDDLYRKDLLEKWAMVLERHADVGFVFNHYDSATPERHNRSRFNEERLDGKWFFEKILLARWDSPIRGTAMIRRSCWDRVGGMREQFNLVADVDLWMRLSRLSNVGYVAERLIYVRDMRPTYYPDIYKSTRWSWRRKLLGYEIHASNRLDYLAMNTLKGRLRWWAFRLRLSWETSRLLLRALVRKRWRRQIIASSRESVTEYDLWPLSALRRVLQLIVRSTEA